MQSRVTNTSLIANHQLKNRHSVFGHRVQQILCFSFVSLSIFLVTCAHLDKTSVSRMKIEKFIVDFNYYFLKKKGAIAIVAMALQYTTKT
jgi:hypothetical protein